MLGRPSQDPSAVLNDRLSYQSCILVLLGPSCYSTALRELLHVVVIATDQLMVELYWSRTSQAGLLADDPGFADHRDGNDFFRKGSLGCMTA